MAPEAERTSTTSFRGYPTTTGEDHSSTHDFRDRLAGFFPYPRPFISHELFKLEQRPFGFHLSQGTYGVNLNLFIAEKFHGRFFRGEGY